MSLKKNLISSNKGGDKLRCGQAVIEYIVIFIAFTLAAITFISQVHNNSGNGVLDQHFDNMVNKILE